VPRFYLTTPIYYVNDIPHLGHAYTMVNADAISRWHRLLGDDVLFLTGTDEHGLKVARAAEQNGMTPQEWTDRTSRRFVEAWEQLEMSNDRFIRTTDPRHHSAVAELLSRIHDNGYIHLDSYRGPYCVGCEAYYGPDELVDGCCPVHGVPVDEVEEENYFFALSRFGDRLLEWYETNPNAVMPESKRNEAIGFIRGGLKDISITRTSIDWGVKVPWDPAHVFYVWYDALVNYVTAIGFGSDDSNFAHWWPAVHHLIGKDILRFHCVWWPAMCMAAGIDPPKSIFVHGWLLVGGEKMAKSKLNQVHPAELVSEIGVDALRYHLLRDTPLGPDGDFSYEGMIARYNSDLANNLGNLASRVAAVVAGKCGGIGPAPRRESRLALEAEVACDAAQRAWESFAPHEALEATWKLLRETNAELETSEPWKKEPGAEVNGVLGDALEVLRIVGLLASPAMPSTCTELWRRIGLRASPLDARFPRDAAWGGYPGGLVVERGSPLFPRKQAASSQG
jgi:methionyl-tRNA synthetase